jgi:predicted nucleotide-binding protein
MNLCENCLNMELNESIYFCKEKKHSVSYRDRCNIFKSNTETISIKHIFIGSSSSAKALNIADCVHMALEQLGFSPSVWADDIFSPTKANLENLISILDTFEAGVFIFHPEDVIKIKNDEKLTVRDNVLFELGLFIGRFGREKAFIVHPKSLVNETRIATDLLGVTFITYEDRAMINTNNWLSILGPKIRTQIGKRLK